MRKTIETRIFRNIKSASFLPVYYIKRFEDAFCLVFFVFFQKFFIASAIRVIVSSFSYPVTARTISSFVTVTLKNVPSGSVRRVPVKERHYLPARTHIGRGEHGLRRSLRYILRDRPEDRVAEIIVLPDVAERILRPRRLRLDRIDILFVYSVRSLILSREPVFFRNNFIN